VAANWEAADDLVRSLAASRGALLGIHRLTLNRLIGLLAAGELAARGLVPLSPLAAEAVAARAIHKLYSPTGPERSAGSSSDSPDFFSEVVQRPGFPGAVAETIEEVRQAGIDPAQLKAADRSGAALGAILERFVSELNSASLIDRAGLIRLAIDALGRRGRFTGLPTLLLDIPIASAAQRDLVAALAALAPAVLATVPAGDHRTERYLGEALAARSERLEQGDGPEASSLELLQRHLFETSAPQRCMLDGSVAIFSAPGESRECVEIVRAIQAQAQRGVPFDQIAVLMHAPAQYLPHLEEALGRAEIPAYFCAGTRRPEPGGRALLALLACAAESLSARRFSEYLSLAQVPDWAAPQGTPAFVAPDPELTPAALGSELEVPAAADESTSFINDPTPVVEGTLRAPWRWEELIVEASVIGSRDRWRRRLDGLREELLRKRAEIHKEDPSSARLDRQLLDLDHLREVALKIIDALAALPGKAVWGEWLAHLRALTALAIRDSAPVLAVLAELEPMAPVGPIELEEVRNVLSRRLGTLTERPPRRRYGAVFVGPASAARGLCFDVVLVPALSERLFPRKVIQDPILNDEARKRLSDHLEVEADRVMAERLALRIAAGAARRQLYLSYPRLDLEQGRPRVPSFYALEVLRAAEGYLPGFDELAQRAAAVDLRLGWPAPPDEQQAIDNAEFDLALLQGLADTNPAATTGAAHYLLSANVHLARALRARARRWLRRWTPADGLVDPNAAARAAMEHHRLDRRSFSATALQHYAKCPYRFFLYAIHRLEPREEPEAIEMLDPLTRGSLFHEVQFDLLSQLRERAMLPVSADNLGAAQDLVDGRLDERARYYYEKLAPAIKKVWEDGIASVRADLREWLRRMAEDSGGWCPERFELSFGLADREQADPASSADPVNLECGICLRGSIDLVERNSAHAVRVTDHKTGKVRADKGVVVGGGAILQPVLYALAAEKLLGQEVAAGRLYYCTSAGGYEDRVVELNRKIENAGPQLANCAPRDVAHQVAAIIGGALADCFLPAAPAKDECARCDYLMVCGPHEELRLKRKPIARLLNLSRLRELP